MAIQISIEYHLVLQAVCILRNFLSNNVANTLRNLARPEPNQNGRPSGFCEPYISETKRVIILN